MGLPSTMSWFINRSGSTLNVYNMLSNGSAGNNVIGSIYNNEIFAEGSNSLAYPWEGEDIPVYFTNSSGVYTFGALKESDVYPSQFEYFSNLVSNGSSWESSNNSMARILNRASNAIYADGTGNIQLPRYSVVTLASSTRGTSQPNRIAITSCWNYDTLVTTNFVGAGFLDMKPQLGSMPDNCTLRKFL